jgi:branched-chain amino acid transport system substrate-binding protein
MEQVPSSRTAGNQETRMKSVLPLSQSIVLQAGKKYVGLALTAAVTSGLFFAPLALAQKVEPLKIGVLSDMSGSLSDLAGQGSALAAKLAIEDAGGRVLNRPVELLEGDHLNKPDTGLTIARKWYDTGVRAIFDVGLTSVALGIQDLAKEKNQLVIYSATASADLYGKNCSPNGFFWTYDNYVQSLGAVKAMVDRGAKTWYFITIDYAFGKNIQRDATALIEAAGGKVIGSTTHPFTASDFSSQLLQAQASKADVIALATITTHAAIIIKQADEFGIRGKGQKIAPLSIQINTIKAMGLKPMQDVYTTEAYYWDQDEATRKFAMRFKERAGKMPNQIQAGVYSGVTHYLKAVAAAGTDDTAAVAAKMRSIPINDMMTKNGSIRADGRVLRDMFVFRVKKPSESKGDWDLYTQVSTIPAAKAAVPADRAVCSLIK